MQLAQLQDRKTMRFTQDWLNNYNAKRGSLVSSKSTTVCHAREKSLHEDIIETCISRGWIYLHGSTAHRTHRTAGEPDFCILPGNGRIVFVECKTGSGKLSQAQLGFIAHAEKLGVSVHVVRSMEEFLKAIDETT